jgi:hypothetical protein
MSLNPNGAPPGYYYQAGATAYIIDPAGTYSLGGATAPTTDPAGTYSGAGASAPTTDPAGTYSGKRATAPTLAAAGTYIPVAGATSSAAEIVDLAGTYSSAGASAPTADPTGTYSAPGATAPTLAAAGTYIPGAGATSSAAEIVDLAGTYSSAGASAPTTDPAGTYSGAGASAPTTDLAGAYSSAGASAPTADPAGTYSTAGASAPTTDPAGSYSGAGASAPTVDPPGTYSSAGATAPTTDPAGTYSGAGASAPTPADAGAYIPFTGATSEATEIVDPAGTYSGAGASAPTLAAAGTYIPLAGSTSVAAEIVDSQGTYSGAGAAAPTLAAPGTYIPTTGATSSAAEIIDPAGTYSGPGQAVPTGDPAGAYSLAGASAPTPAAAGTFIPVYDATSAAAEIVDGGGTYSLSGATTPTADPAGTYSAPGASAPTEDPAGTYSSLYALDRLFLDTTSVTPGNEVLSFNSLSAVANYYGDTSVEAGLAVDFFAGYGTSATMLFVRDPIGGNRAHLYGANVSDLTLAQLQAISGQLSITSQGYLFTGSINLSGVKSFTAAATAIQAALNQNLPVAAVTTGDSIAPVSVSFTGSTNGLLLDVTAVSSGAIEIGALVSGAKVPAGTQINSQISGTPGGVGIYSLYVPAGTISSETMTESYGVLTIGSTSSGTVADGEQVTGAGVAPLTAIEANLSGSGAGSTWLVNFAQTLASESMTMTAAPLSVLYTAIIGDTANRGYFSIQQNGDFLYNSSSLTYATGSAAASLDLTLTSGAYDSTPGQDITSSAAFMNNVIQTEDGQFASFQSTWQSLAQESPQSQAAFFAWAQSTDGLYTLLQNSFSNTPPAGASAPTTDPAGAYSGAGASAPTLAAAGTYIPAAGATSAAAEKVDKAGTYSLAGASAPTTDPAGTYSAAGASAPTSAAPGTYIPGTGATSTKAQKVDPAGTYSGAGASAPTTDPAGTYSAAGASAPTPAAAGTYIPVTGATSAAAEMVDPAGSYSLAGASAPTLAQPGYYVPTPGASSETPDSAGYYTPYAGATAELQALPPVISGTVAGQSVAPGQTDTPFSSVVIVDPNIDTSDSLSIQLTGGGALADGAGFDGLTMSAPGVYVLSGTAAAITTELDALVFTPSAYSTTTTFTLTDTTSIGTGASDTNTTVTVESSGPVVVSVSTFLANQSSLDQTPGGFDILDSAGAITASLDQLDDSNINVITILDNGQVDATVQQLTTDATAIGKLRNPNSSPVLLAIDDTAQDVEAGLSTLVADASEIASIAVSGGPVVVSVTTFLSDQSALDKIAGGFAISDSAGDVAQNLDALNGDANITSITLTDGGVPTLSLSIEQALNDTLALSEITSPHTTVLSDSASASITSTQALFLAGEGISVVGAPVIATGTVATMAILAKIQTSNLVAQGYTLAVLDIAANIEGLTLAQINNLSIRDVLLLQASDTNVALSANLVLSLEAADMTVTAPSGFAVTLTAPKASVSALSTTTIVGLPALGVSSIVSTNGSVSINVAQALALEAVDIGITVPAGDSVSLSDLASNIAMLTLSQIAALPAIGVSAIAVSNSANLALSVAEAVALEAGGVEVTAPTGYAVTVSDSAADIATLSVAQISGLPAIGVSSVAVSNSASLALSVAQAQALEAASLGITTQTGYAVTISDSAADIATLAAAQFSGLPAVGVGAIDVTDNNSLTLSAAQTTALETSGVSLSLQSGYSVLISDSASDIESLTAGQIAGLSALDVTGTNATDTSVSLTVARAEALESAGIPVTAPAGATVQASDTAAHLEGLTASQIDGLTAIGVTGLVSTNANVSYSPTQTAAILSSGLTVSAPASDTVTENFANGDYSVYQGGQLIQQQTVNADGSYDVAYFDVTGKAYSSYEDIYNSAGTLVADAQSNVNGAGTLLLYASGLTVTSSSGSDSVTTGSDTFAITPQSVETLNVQNSMSSETFVFGPGFGQDTLIGFLETGSNHDLLQFSASTYGFPSTQSQTADAQALLSNYASGTTNTVITDPQSDTLTINNHAASTFQNNRQDFKFT